MIAHAKLSASGSHRWIACPGSVKAEEGYPDTTSIFADWGTACHELSELVLTQGGSSFDWESKTLPISNSTTVDREMASCAQEYVDYVRQIPGELMIEQRVDFSHLVPGGFGTSDALIIDGTHLHCVDLKGGKGVRVDAEENTQGLLYALGALNDYGLIYDIQTITISIVQPRLDHISEWTIPRTTLDAWGEFIRKAACNALADDAQRVPGEKQCQWCKAKATCPALQQLTNNTLLGAFDTIADRNPDTLTDEQVRHALEHKKLIVSWLDAVETLVTERLEAGHAFPGFKLVEGRSNRCWTDEQAARDALVAAVGEAAYEPAKLLSVAKAEKVLGKSKAAVLDGLVSKPQGAPTLVADTDPRPSVTISTKDFDVLF